MSPNAQSKGRRTLTSYLALSVALQIAALAAFFAWMTVSDYGTARNAAVASTTADAREAATQIDASIEATMRVLTVEASRADAGDLASSCSVTSTGVGAFPSATFSVVRPDGSIACSSSADDSIGYAGSRWFSRVVSDETLVVDGALKDPNTGRPAIVVAVPFADGAMAMVFDADRIAVGTDTSDLVVSTRKGDVVTGSPASSNDHVVAEAPMRSLPWTIEASVSNAAAFAAPWNALQSRGAFSLVLVALLVALGWTINRRIARPIRALVGAVDEAAGAAEPVRVPEDGPQEVSHLGRRLNGMIREKAENQIGLVQMFEGENDRRAGGRREVDRMKSAFLMAISHELRTPLAIVTGYAEMLQDSIAMMSEDEAAEMAHDICLGARRLERLLIDILDVEKISRGVFEAQPRPTHLRELVDRVLEFSDTHGSVKVDIPNGLVVNVDPGLTERVLDNLVRNAVKHTPAGTPIWVGVDICDGELEVTVADAGPGVPDALKVDVFEAFTQGATPSHSPGTGIGLSLVAQFARLHRGRAWVDDRPGGGARFHVTFADARPVEKAA